MVSKKVKKTSEKEMVWNEVRQKKLDSLLKEHKTLLEELSKK